MPQFRKLSDAEVEKLTRRRNNLEELEEYVKYLQDLKPGSWGSIQLAQDESQRTVKRRTSIAATSLDKKIRWRSNRSNGDELIFQVLDPK